VYLSYFLIPQLVGMSLVRRPEALRRYVVAILLVFEASLIIHFFAPTSPPWLVALDGHIGSVKRILWDVLHPLWPQRLEDGYRASQNDYAAMPSVHIALTLLAALAAVKEWRSLRYPAAVYVFAMTFSVVYLGEHYLIDTLAGGALALLAWAVARSAKQHHTNASEQ
jgi:membrane-associated phospholipid phosphatase